MLLTTPVVHSQEHLIWLSVIAWCAMSPFSRSAYRTATQHAEQMIKVVQHFKMLQAVNKFQDIADIVVLRYSGHALVSTLKPKHPTQVTLAISHPACDGMSAALRTTEPQDAPTRHAMGQAQHAQGRAPAVLHALPPWPQAWAPAVLHALPPWPHKAPPCARRPPRSTSQCAPASRVQLALWCQPLQPARRQQGGLAQNKACFMPHV